jgi:hypothetical protein
MQLKKSRPLTPLNKTVYMITEILKEKIGQIVSATALSGNEKRDQIVALFESLPSEREAELLKEIDGLREERDDYHYKWHNTKSEITSLKQQIDQYRKLPHKVVCNNDCPDAEFGNCCHPSNCQKKIESLSTPVSDQRNIQKEFIRKYMTGEFNKDREILWKEIFKFFKPHLKLSGTIDEGGKRFCECGKTVFIKSKEEGK